MITVSIVSHGHGEMVSHLLADLVSCPEVSAILLTLNIPEPDIRVPPALADRLTYIRNAMPQGFGANHNQAFRQAGSPYFCILNPDIRIFDNPFPILLASLECDEYALAAPMIVNMDGEIEDSARYLPSPWGVFCKLLGRGDGRYHYRAGDPAFTPDWVGGMFMLVNSGAFRAANGFDERFFLYYEDVDLCSRMTLAAQRLILCPGAAAVHDARRASHRNLRFLRWHLSSILRFFCSSVFWRCWLRKFRRG